MLIYFKALVAFGCPPKPPPPSSVRRKKINSNTGKNAHGVPLAQEARKSRCKTGRKNKNISNKALVCNRKQRCGGARTAQIVAQDARKRPNPCFLRVLYVPSQQNVGSYYVTNMCCCQVRGAVRAQERRKSLRKTSRKKIMFCL